MVYDDQGTLTNIFKFRSLLTINRAFDQGTAQLAVDVLKLDGTLDFTVQGTAELTRIKVEPLIAKP
jgi:hypothetical protein